MHEEGVEVLSCTSNESRRQAEGNSQVFFVIIFLLFFSFLPAFLLVSVFLLFLLEVGQGIAGLRGRGCRKRNYEAERGRQAESRV